MVKHMRRFTISGGFLLFASVLFFLDNSGMLAAAIPAILIHEFGHFAAIRLLGGRVGTIRIDLSGVTMDYAGAFSEKREFIIALAGPFLGLVYAAGTSAVGTALESRFLLCSSGISLILSVYNLLPAFPLDGGRLLHYFLTSLFGRKTADRTLVLSSFLVGAVLIVTGIYAVEHGFGLALCVAGAWILLDWGTAET
jgi:stage IV sporulation protein FB